MAGIFCTDMRTGTIIPPFYLGSNFSLKKEEEKSTLFFFLWFSDPLLLLLVGSSSFFSQWVSVLPICLTFFIWVGFLTNFFTFFTF